MSVRSWLHRGIPSVIAVVALTVALATMTVAAADDNPAIDINGGNVPTTAETFGDHSCDQVPNSIKENEDGWVFVLPNNKWRFASVTAVFTDLEGGTQTMNGTQTKPPNGMATSKFYIVTPAGWTLVSATAEVEPKSDERPGPKPTKFNLTHTCPGTPEEPEPEPSTMSPTPSSESPSSQTPTGESPSSQTPTGQTPSSPGESPTASATASDDASAPGGPGAMPITGRSLLLPLALGLVLLAVGGAVMIAARRRRAASLGDNAPD